MIDKMGGAYNMHSRRDIYKILVLEPEVNSPLGRHWHWLELTLKSLSLHSLWVLEFFSFISVGPGGWVLWRRLWIFEFYKTLRISRPPDCELRGLEVMWPGLTLRLGYCSYWTSRCLEDVKLLLESGKGKATPLQAWTGPEGSRRLRLRDFKTIGTWKW